MVKITEEKFNQTLDQLDAMTYRCQDWFPTLEEIKKHIEPRIEDDQLMLKFALWILETSKSPCTDEDKQARRYLMNLVNSQMEVE